MSLLLGAVVAWGGTIQNIPSGWALCDGQDGRPDLRNKFIIGAGDLYSVGDTGGSADAVLVSHTHTGSTNTTGAHVHTLVFGFNRFEGPFEAQGGNTNIFNRTISGADSHTHTFTMNAVGGSENGVGKNLPPYYALAYIIQIS